MKENKFDILIVGGGLAGLATAIQFAQKQHRVALFEKEHYPFHKVCGEYISNESWEFISALGIPLSELELPKINQLSISDPKGNMLHEPLELGGFGISRYTLDKLMKQRAETFGVTVFEGTEVKKWEYTEGLGFTLFTSDQHYSGTLLFSAHGKRSKLDSWLNRSFMKKKEPYLAVKYHIRYPVNPSEIVLHNFKNGYCGMSAIEEGKACLCYLAHADDLKAEGSIEALEQHVLAKNPHLAKIFQEAEFLYEKPVVISRFSFQPKKQIIDHVVYIGDAAGLIPPLSGNGMSMALHGAKLAYEAFEPFLRGKYSRAVAESTYAKNWKKNFSLRLRVGRSLQAVFGAEEKTILFFKLIRPFGSLRRYLVRLTHGKSF